MSPYEPAEDLDPSDLDDGANATLTGYVVSIDKEEKILGLLLTSLEEQKEDTAGTFTASADLQVSRKSRHPFGMKSQ